MMDVIEQQFQVTVRYPVHFTTGVFAASNPLLRDLVARPKPAPSTRSGDPLRKAAGPARMVVVVDRGVEAAHPHLLDSIAEYARVHGAALQLAVPVVVVPGGESIKNDRRHVDRILDALNAAGLCRHSYLVAVGGGAVLDAAGFAAATAHRGVRLIRVPTTVLAQGDSAVGVKNGINAYGKKNYIGTFAPPFAVVNDFSFLPTLSERDWRGGVTEAVKAALVRDPQFFEYLEAHAAQLLARDLTIMEQVVRRSALLHLTHIATGGDPFEQGSSRPLDFGHWAAHKLEQMTDHRLRHGEAVGVGIALDTTYAHLAGFLGESEWRRIVQLIVRLGIAVHVPALAERLETPTDAGCVLHGLAEFQEHLGGELTIMLLSGIGRPFDVHEIRLDLMTRAIDILKEIEEQRVESAAKKAS